MDKEFDVSTRGIDSDGTSYFAHAGTPVVTPILFVFPKDEDIVARHLKRKFVADTYLMGDVLQATVDAYNYADTVQARLIGWKNAVVTHGN